MKDFGPGVYTGVITSAEHPGVPVTDPVMPTW
jgi:hypothetical protein